MKSKFFPVVLTAAITAFFTVFLYSKFQPETLKHTSHAKTTALPVNYTIPTSAGKSNIAMMPAGFETAAQAAVPAVVHVKTLTKARTVTAVDPHFNNDFFGNLFGLRQQYYIPPQSGSGSGVVFRPDGYIVTNYHVVANAEKVAVTFDDRYTTEAEIVGKDPATDIAVLKVPETDLPYMEFGNSDQVQLGQWVLAVGYPLTLDATVTAGIVSAKSRSIGINRTQSASAIESFIQTDAAVNPGNSGGALVNTAGQLIGINSAIASPTGSYAGYSYAIPSNIVKKVVDDIVQYGIVQRAYLGIEYVNRKLLKPEELAELGIDKKEGVYVAGVAESGGAYKAGIKKGDFITAINGVPIRTEPELLEQIARYKPGDHISVTYERNNKTYQTMVELKNIKGNTEIVKEVLPDLVLGAGMRSLKPDELKKLKISGGVLVTEIRKGIIAEQTNIRKGFVITGINEQPVTSPEQIQQAIASGGNIQIRGFYPGSNGIYYYGIRL
jgi:serine protease Do